MPDPTPDERADVKPPEPVKAPKKPPRMVVLATVQPYHTFTPSVDGVPPITNAGTSVPAASVPAIRLAAEGAAVQLKEL